MNGKDNNNNTPGAVSRNTYYNMDVPEWRCENCGRFNHREARFCRSCGSPGPMAEMPANDVYVAEMPQKKGGAGKWIAIVAAIVIVVAAITFVVIKFVLPGDDQNSAVSTNNQTETTTGTSDNNTNANNDAAVNQEQNTDIDQDTSGDSYYTVGGTYYVQPDDGVNVREGPGTNYNVVLNPDGKKVALRRGTSVVCEEMSDDGNWMRISSGWICVWDGNETLVR